MDARFFKQDASRLVILGGAVVCVLLGFALGRIATPTAIRPEISQNAEQSAATPRHRREDSRPPLAQVRIDQLAYVPISEIREVLADRDPTEIAQLAHKFDALPPNPQTYANLRPFFRTWAETDAVAAFHGAVALANPFVRTIAVETIANAASPAGAGAIVQLVVHQPPGTFQERILDQLLDPAVLNWSQTDPSGAATFILTDPDCRMRIGGEVLRNFGWIQGPTALAWLEEHPGVNDKQEFSDIMKGWVEKDPLAASAYATDHLDTPKVRETIGQTAFFLFCVNKDVALKWAEKLPSPAIRQEAYAEIADRYAELTPTEAAEWSAQLPADEREAALRIVFIRWTNQNSQAALAWINNHRSEVGDDAMQAALEHLLQTSPAEAEAWIKSSSLSPKQKAELLSKSSTEQSP